MHMYECMQYLYGWMDVYVKEHTLMPEDYDLSAIMT